MIRHIVILVNILAVVVTAGLVEDCRYACTADYLDCVSGEAGLITKEEW